MVPTGYAEHPARILTPPRSLAEGTYGNIQRWTRMPRGGHLPARSSGSVGGGDSAKGGVFVHAGAARRLISVSSLLAAQADPGASVPLRATSRPVKGICLAADGHLSAYERGS